MGSLELKKGLKWWVSRAKENVLKEGSWVRHIPVLPSSVSASPPRLIYLKSLLAHRKLIFVTILFSSTGLGNHNFCRNPDEDQKPWCYYGNATRPLVGWKYCAINQCETPPPPPVAPRTEAPPPPPAPVTTRSPNSIGKNIQFHRVSA